MGVRPNFHMYVQYLCLHNISCFDKFLQNNSLIKNEGTKICFMDRASFRDMNEAAPIV